MAGRCTFAASRRLRLVVLLTLVTVPGCAGSSPLAPGSAPPTISGYVYLSFTPDTGEPPIEDVLITVRDSTGAERTTVSGRSGYYSVRAEMGTVVVTASKPGYETRQSRFDVSESTVLNFSLKPTLQSHPLD
ncbi:MAG TPA: carboxypeptidase-like regulatory domain-containing protein [Vicinamibacterales bacterium]|nr:carboxypeptidase-like regulatory domain-containing protein [Vicinamibacterales bacterium]